MSEKLPNPENSLDQLRRRAVEILRGKGPDDPETKQALIAWHEARTALESSENTGIETARTNLEYGELLADAGLGEYSLEVLEDALYQAQHQEDWQLGDKIKSVIDRVKGK